MMDVIELIEALKTADGETAMELVERLQCGKVDCSALSANGGKVVAYRYRVKGGHWEAFSENPCLDGCGPNEEVEPLYTHPAPPSVAVPEGWRSKRLYSVDGDAFGARISTPRVDGVCSNTSVWTDDEDMARRMLALMLTAAPAPDHIADAGKVVSGLSFRSLREANAERINSSKYEQCERNWTPAHWMQATVGELGELANLLKKVDRGDFPFEQVKDDVARELADVQSYLDILSLKLGVDLGQATIDKFNEASERIGSHVMLSAAPSVPEEEVRQLEEIRALIEGAPVDSLGTGKANNCAPWPIRDEVVYNISRVIDSLSTTITEEH